MIVVQNITSTMTTIKTWPPQVMSGHIRRTKPDCAMKKQFTITATVPMNSKHVCQMKISKIILYLWILSSKLNLPSPNILHPLSERALHGRAQFEGIDTNFQNIVEQTKQWCQREHGSKEDNVTELDKHLQIVVQRAGIARQQTLDFCLTDFWSGELMKNNIWISERF